MVSIDIPLIDAASIACAVCFPVTRIVRSWLGKGEKPHVLLMLLDLLRGAAFFPFLILIGGAFSNEILQHLITGNRLHLFLAGVIGAGSVFKSDRWLTDFARAAHLEPPGLAPST
jgi:uncharacterized membrane protein YdcZ (DUF606 family)